jgi:succinate-semialdehyde dehydrogenase/glutarate-semialdehyde dehydrogenase
MTSQLTAETAAPALRDSGLLRDRAFVDGQWIESDSGETIPVIDPATSAVIAEVPRMGVAETRRAIEAAERAQPAWRAMTAKERGKILRRLADSMVDRQDDLAALLTAEQGKPLAEAKGEILYAAAFFEWFAEEGKRLYGDVIPSFAADRRIVVQKEPVGVTAGITPWNFPAAMITRKAGPALAAGCTMVVKPAKQTPLSGLAICVLAEEAGMPPGVLSMVTGDASTIGGEITGNPTVRKLGFTGSTDIGKLLMAQCAQSVKKVSLELGGNAPFLVFDDADLDAAVEGAILCKFRNSGQTCVCANRFLVQDGVYDDFMERFAKAIAALHVGNGFEPDVKIGPLIDDAGVDKVERHVADAVERGGEVVVGGSRHDLGGTFFEPTLIDGVTAQAAMSCEETFGPVAGVQRFTTDEDGIRLANDTPYGLAAYFYARDVGRIWRVSEALESGIVGVNTGIISTEVAPFGGMKESGIGREGSKYGIEEWVEIKYVCLGL